MMIFKKTVPLLALILTLIFTFTSCKQLDVIGNQSVVSFKDVLNTIPDKVTEDSDNEGWSLLAPDGSARFVWSKDYSESPLYDVFVEFDAKPFVDAGLDVSKLPKDMLVDDKILVGTKLGAKEFNYSGGATPLASYEQIVTNYRSHIKYHSALDHFGVDLGNGAFEWAKDLSKNDKDIVFALNPKPFIDAGVNPDKVAGWKFAKVPAMEDNGRKIEVEKLLKPFNLK